MFTRLAPRAARRRWPLLLPALLSMTLNRAGAVDTITTPEVPAPTTPVVAKEKTPDIDTLEID